MKEIRTYLEKRMNGAVFQKKEIMEAFVKSLGRGV